MTFVLTFCLKLMWNHRDGMRTIFRYCECSDCSIRIRIYAKEIRADYVNYDCKWIYKQSFNVQMYQLPCWNSFVCSVLTALAHWRFHWYFWAILTCNEHWAMSQNLFICKKNTLIRYQFALRIQKIMICFNQQFSSRIITRDGNPMMINRIADIIISDGWAHAEYKARAHRKIFNSN